MFTFSETLTGVSIFTQRPGRAHNMSVDMLNVQFAQFALLTQSSAVFAVFCLHFTSDLHQRTATVGHLVCLI